MAPTDDDTLPAHNSPPGSIPQDTPASDEQLDRFQLERPIGSGGMGQVWEAWDPRLERRVAIKRLHVTDPLARQRFLREARLQASIAHPGICPVFEVGQAGGIPFIVMPRIDGQPLDRAAEDMALEQKLVLVRRVAEAVHTAHGQGLIHRDLKPSNILVEQPEDGPPRPVVLDFGIARSLTGDGLTASGDWAGTPSYMAPEQMGGHGETFDRRTDVYALGATLYRLLAGRPPHGAEGGLPRVHAPHDEPPRLVPLGIPADVEAVVFKCLETSKERRYASALALAEDLGRYLEGEPVRARRITGFVRFRKWLHRHRAAAWVAAVAVPLLVAALGWGAWSSWRAEERQRLAQRFGAQVEQVEALVRYSQMAPLRDASLDRVELRRLLGSIRETLSSGDTPSRALAHHALGQGHLALDELDRAREHLQTAWDLGHRTPEVAADLGRALSELYRDRLTVLERVGDLGGRESVRDQLRRRLDRTFGDPGELQKQLQASLGDPARDLLTHESTIYESTIHESAIHSPSQTLRTLILFHDGRPAEALEHLAQLPPRPAWDYEPLRLEGDIRRSWAVELHAEGGDTADADARRQLELARHAYAQVLTVAQSHAAVLRDDAQAIYLLARLDLLASEELDPLLEEGLDNLRKAQQLHPDDLGPQLWIPRLLHLAAEHAIDRGQDPTQQLEAALEAGRRALDIDADSPTLWYELGRVHGSLARWNWSRGGDPAPHLESALEAFAQLPPESQDYAYFTSLGTVRMALAQWRVEAGHDATDEFRRAVAAYRTAAELHSAPFAALSNLGLSLFRMSSLDGMDSVDLLRRAVDIFEQASQLDPDHMVPHYYLGLCHLRLAQGGDAARATLDTALAERAVDDLRRATGLTPDRFQPWIGLGEALHLRALDAHTRGGDPAPFFERARQAHGRALELSPDQPVALLNLAWTAYFQGKFALRSHGDGTGDPTPWLDEAGELCGRSLEVRRRATALLCLGSVRRLQAEALAETGEIPGAADHLAEARGLLEEILTLDPNHAEAHRSLGRLSTLEARWLHGRGEDPAPTFERARRELDRALQINRGLGTDPFFFWLADTRWHLAQAEWLTTSRDEDAGPARSQALAAAREGLARAARSAPGSPDVDQLRGRLDSLAATH